MTAIEHEVPVEQLAHPVVQMDVRHVRDVEGIKFLEEGAGPPIVFLHGIGGGAAGFAAQLAHFGKRYRAIAWEMPGYAGSVPLPVVTVAGLAASLGLFLRALGLERPVLVGHSLGGMVLQRLLVEAPHIAGAVVLSQTAAAFGGKNPGWADAFVADKLGPLDAGRSMEALAPEVIGAMVGEGADAAGVAAAEACFASGAGEHVSRHGAGDAGLRPARRAAGAWSHRRWCSPGAPIGPRRPKGCERMAAPHSGGASTLWSCQARGIWPMRSSPAPSTGRWTCSWRNAETFRYRP